MARVTVEDCVRKLQNKFELVALAAQRAKSISRGAPITVDRDNDKNAVIALREIALDHLDVEQLKEELISSLQTRNKIDIIEEENLHAESKDNVIDVSDDSVMFEDEASLNINFSNIIDSENN